MSKSGPHSERAIILAPRGRDAELAAKLLSEAGFPSNIVTGLEAVRHEAERGGGLAIIADDAVRGADLKPLSDFLKNQPAWSDFPIVLLTQRGEGPERNPAAARLGETLGNVIFLERPFHPTTFVSVVRTAIRSRRRQYEARVRLDQISEAENNIQTALTAGHLGSWRLDTQRLELDTSPTCRSHFGRQIDEPFSYDDLRASIHPDDREQMQAAIARSLNDGNDYTNECRNIWPDGSVHWVDMRARAIRGPSGAVDQLIGVSSDITERKTSELTRDRLLRDLAFERAALSELTSTLEQRVNERTEALRTEIAARVRAQDQLVQSQKMEGLGQLTGGIAHDFNNLLMAVMGNLQLLQKRVPDDPRLHRLIDGALQGAQRGATLTQRMLTFSRQQELKTNSANVAHLLGGMRDLLDRTLGPQVELVLNIPGDLPNVQVDANQVELAILNLAINARDAMPAGGRIEIAAERGTSGASEHSQGTQFVCVRVSDTGSGMDEETLKRASEPFFTTKPVGKGTGLGLSMVHGLAAQLGGRLELASEIDKGTVVTLWLPVANDVAAADAPVAPIETTSRPATILVVDDDPLIAASTVDMLEDLGHTVIEANSAKRALEILDAGQEVDLMMTDQAMPGMTGSELAEVVQRTWPDLPVLLATGYADFSSEAARDLPRLSKPYLQSDLQEQIARLLRPVADRVGEMRDRSA